jgi:hypothetical protein
MCSFRAVPFTTRSASSNARAHQLSSCTFVVRTVRCVAICGRHVGEKVAAVAMAKIGTAMTATCFMASPVFSLLRDLE